MKLNASGFAAFVKERCARKDGYIFGARGEYTKNVGKSSWYVSQYSGSQKVKALSWLASAERVWDCWGFAEGYVNQETGSDIDIRAKDGYAGWCEPKGKGKIPAGRRVPGVAVFMGDGTAGGIDHVGFLVQPVEKGKPEGDWYVAEARGVMYGCVVTKLSERRWTHWGWMSKHFDYAQVTDEAEDGPVEAGDGDDGAMGDSQKNPYAVPGRILKYKRGEPLVKGQDVKWVQFELNQSGEHLDIDGQYGPKTFAAVKRYQKAHGLTADGEVGPLTIAALLSEWDVCEHGGGDTEEAPTPPVPSVDRLDSTKPSPDISYYDGKVDWAKVDVPHVWIREGDSLRKRDPEFTRNVSGAVKHGIPWSAYLFFRAGTLAEMRKEVNTFADRILATGQTPVSVVLDVEVTTVTTSVLKAARALLDERFGPEIGKGIYMAHHLYDRFKSIMPLYDYFWVPRYNGWKTPPAHPYHIWQGAFEAFDGIRGGKKAVDCNRVKAGYTWAQVFARRAVIVK